MSQFFLFVFICTTTLILGGCSAAEFGGGGTKTASKKPIGARTPDDQTGTNPMPGPTSTPDPSPDDPPGPLSVDQQQRCWFAVSGAPFLVNMDPDHPSHSQRVKFPLTMSGNPIKHGESFDLYGGVYLQSSATPYEHEKGGRELDQAIKDTFDAVLVAPGMNIEIRDGAGNEVYTGKGPFIGLSIVGNGQHLQKWVTTKRKIPDWVRDVLRTKNGFKTLPPGILQSSRWVKVSAVPGGDCVPRAD